MLVPSLPLDTARLTLRPYEEGDLAGLHDLFGHEDVVRYHEWEPMEVETSRALLDRRMRRIKRR